MLSRTQELLVLSEAEMIFSFPSNSENGPESDSAAGTEESYKCLIWGVQRTEGPDSASALAKGLFEPNILLLKFAKSRLSTLCPWWFKL